MKNLLAAFLLLLCGCASTNFTEYRGPAMVAGKGGTVRTVDGVDFWENGDPDRKYQILGVVDDKRGEGIFAPNREKDLAKVCKEHGGDAIVLVSSSRELRGIDDQGKVNYRRVTKVMVVKYVP